MPGVNCAMARRQRRHGMTLLETLVVLVLLSILVAMLAPALAPPRRAVPNRLKQCLWNLKEVGMAFRAWETDNLDYYPMAVSTNDGGSEEYDTNTEVFRHFLVMQDDLGNSPKWLYCPADRERAMATNFAVFSNSNLSYFLSMTVSNSEDPNQLLAGDRDIGDGLHAGPGLLTFATNDPVRWTLGLHSDRNFYCGNFLQADGSGFGNVTTPALRKAFDGFGAKPTIVAVP